MEKFKFIVPLLLFTHLAFPQNSSRLRLGGSFPYSNGNLPSQIRKPSIDTSVFDKWPSIAIPPYLSNDGKYAGYFIDHLLSGAYMLVLQSTQNSWKTEIPGGTYPLYFTQDSRRAVFTKSNDSLGIAVLGSPSVEYIPNVRPFSCKLPKKGTSEWLAYQLTNPEKELVIRNLVTGKQQSYNSVSNYLFDDEGNTLLLQIEVKKDSGSTVALHWINLFNNKATTIWEGATVTSFAFDKDGTQLAFTEEHEKNNQPENAIWYYKAGMDKAILLANDHSAGIDGDLQLENVSGFSKDGGRIFFSLKEREAPKPGPDAVKVDIWSYTDAKLQSQQLNELGPKSFTAVIHTNDHRIIRLTQEGERVLPSFPPFEDRTDNLALIENRKGSDEKWHNSSQVSVYLVSTNNGEREWKNEKAVEFFPLSPEGKFVIYYDPVQENYFSYEVSSGIVRNITRGIPVSWIRHDDIAIRSYNIPLGVVGWMKEDAAVLLYDQYDVWQVEPRGNKPPVNLTNGYGRKHNIVFRWAMEHRGTPIEPNGQILLNAFNRSNKDAGFYSITLNRKADPELLTIGPYTYSYNGLAPLKAAKTETYIIRRMSATESPNFFSTNDFKTFTPLSNLHPEKKYNWLTTELLTWKTFDGHTSQGVLYKPENFDPKKKYPVIFHYYEKMSDELNVYNMPEAAEGWINIPWFVSNGYLVFTPDIHYTIGEPGQSAYNSVVSAAKYLAKFPWVNAAKMGIQGHSFGGYETNYLVTHSNIFAAAMSSSSVSDCVSGYGYGGGGSQKSVYESGQFYIGATLWQRPDLYIKNSPVFQAYGVTTPVLMMNNKEDEAVPFAQGVEFFTALRRLGKKAWMLQYDGEAHSLITENAKKDYTIRITQFFDHYLKDTPPPKWMTAGVPASRKGIDRGIELDLRGKQPISGYDTHSHQK